MAERKAKEGPEIVDIDLTTKLLTIAHHSANDAGLRAVHAAARHQLMELNAGIQEQIDKVNKAQADKIAADEAKAVEDARLAKRKAEDEEAAAAKKAEKVEHKNEARPIPWVDFQDSEPDLEARRSLRRQDCDFCERMLAAVLRRQEHPPMVGIDTRPGTRNPIVLAR